MEDTQSQLWALFGTVVVYLAGKAWSYFRDRLDGNRRDQLASMERWAEKSAAWALLHFPGLDADLATDRAIGQLRTILSNLHLDPGDDVGWAHLHQVVHEFIIHTMLDRKAGKVP